MSNNDALDQLRKKVGEAKEKFAIADENIKKISSANFNSNRPPGRMNDMSNRGSFMKRNLPDNLSGPQAKSQRTNFSQITFKNQKNNSNETENQPGEDTRTVISSSVVRVEKSRKDAIQDRKHTENPDDKQRGRRMFGVLLTTLAKFKTESDSKSFAKQDKALQKIEEKIAESKKEDEEVLKKEKEEYIEEKRAAESEIRLLQEQIRITEIFETWKKEVLRTKNYIRTDTKPYIYYRPKQSSSETDKRLSDSCKAIDEMIAAKKAKLDADFAKLTEESKSRFTRPVKQSAGNKSKHESDAGNFSSSSSRAPSPNLDQSDNDKPKSLKSSIVQTAKPAAMTDDKDNESEISEGEDDIVLESAEQPYNDTTRHDDASNKEGDSNNEDIKKQTES